MKKNTQKTSTRAEVVRQQTLRYTDWVAGGRVIAWGV
jgi:hypothetical protein